MRFIDLPTLWTVIIDIIAWFIIHMAVVYIMVRLPNKHFRFTSWLYRERDWEHKGHFYQASLKIKKWKKYLPDGAELLKDKGFPKRRLKEKNATYLSAFRRETCRAELTHWITMLFAPLFFFWNPFFVGFIMIFYAMAENIPLIMAQRFNRHRITRVLKLKGLKSEISNDKPTAPS